MMKMRVCVLAGLVLVIFLFSECRAQNADYTILHSAITREARTGELQYLSSPGYPKPYGSHQDLQCTLRTGPGQKVHLHVEDMDLQPLGNCGPNTVIVYDSDSEAGRVLAIMCNEKDRGADLYSTGSAMTVAFTSTVADQGKGFRLGFEATPSPHTQVKKKDKKKHDNIWTPDGDDGDNGISWVSHNVVGIVSVSVSLLFVAMVIMVIGVYGRNRWNKRHRSADQIINVPGGSDPDLSDTQPLIDDSSGCEPSESESEEGPDHRRHHEGSQNHLDVSALDLWMSTHFPDMMASQINVMPESHHHGYGAAVRPSNEVASQASVGDNQPNMADHQTDAAVHQPRMPAQEANMAANWINGVTNSGYSLGI